MERERELAQQKKQYEDGLLETRRYKVLFCTVSSIYGVAIAYIFIELWL